MACYIQLAQHICYNSFIDTGSGADMTGNQSNHGNTSGDMPGEETSKPVSTTMSGWNVQKATNVFKQAHHVTRESRGEVFVRDSTIWFI